MYINSHLPQMFPKPRLDAWFYVPVFLSKVRFPYWDGRVHAKNITKAALQPEKGAGGKEGVGFWACFLLID